MTPKTIVLHVDHEKADGPQTRYALGLAKLCGAHVTGAILVPEHAIPAMVMVDIPTSVLEEQRKNAADEAAKMAAAFDAVAKDADVDHASRVVTDNLDGMAYKFASIARQADLVILGQHSPDRSETLSSVLIETVLFDSGRPVLIVPYIGAKADSMPARPMIAWDGTTQAARAAFDAIPLLGSAGEVELVTVDRGSSTAGLEASGKALAETLKRHGINARFHVVPSGGLSVANTLLSHASDAGTDLLVMGGYGHSRMRELILGGATREILASMTVPVLMAH